MRTASCTCSSGSISIFPASLQQKPGGSMNWNSPRRAFEVASGQAALPHQAEFVFRHRPLQAEQQAVVDDSRIVRALGIDDERPGERAKLDQMMPVPSVTRQPRGLDAIDGADIAGAHHRDQPLEARALDAPRSGPTEIVVDHLYRREARSALRCRLDRIAGAGFRDWRRPAPWSTAARRRSPRGRGGQT